jgi:hypothetical protein
MRRALVSVLFAAACLGALLAAYRSLASEQLSLARYAPSGALLYLEAEDFSQLLSGWNGSPEKEQWLSSADYQVFSRSRLFSRLRQASREFTAAAGLPPDMNLVSQVAGSQSALAVYDIGKLQFLYITKLASDRAEQTALLQSRAKFETRSAGGLTFYYRQDPQSGREAAFAVADGCLLLATREDLMAGALELLAGGKAPSVVQDSWWIRAVGAAGQPGDLRVVLNMQKIVPSPYFRSYWIQQNITAMKAYSAAVSDLYLSAAEYREERVLVKAAPNPASPAAAAAAVSDLARLVPPDAGEYEIHASPSVESSLSLLETKLLAPHAGPDVASNNAPQVDLSSGAANGAGDMETRIDQPPPETPAQAAQPSALKALLTGNPVAAGLDVQKTYLAPDGVFVRFQTAVVLLGASDWNESSVLSAIADFTRFMLTASSLGVNWRTAAGHEELDGLWNLSVAVRGKYLFVSDNSQMLEEMLSNLKEKSAAPPAVLIAGFNHAAERARFTPFASVLDGQTVAWAQDTGRAPSFFSDNIGSLSSIFAGISSEKVIVRDAGDKVLEAVTYEWAK